MNILYFVPQFTVAGTLGGMPTHATGIVAGLTKIGHRVKFACYSPGWRLGSADFKGIHMEFVRLPLHFTNWRVLPEMPVSVVSLLKMRRLLRDVDLVHERFHAPYFVPNRLLGRPIVLEVNNPYVEEFWSEKSIIRPIIAADRKRQFRLARALITQTDTLARMLSGITDKPIHVIPNGVEVSLFGPGVAQEQIDQARRAFKLEGRTVVTFSGTFYPWHGLHQLPYIVERVCGRFGNVRFLVVGKGLEYDKAVAGLPEKLKPYVIFSGPVPFEKVPPLLAASDILISPHDVSRNKDLATYGFWGSPLKLFEYMASGRPVVSFDYPELAKIIRDGGLLAEPGNLDQFVDYLCKLVDDEALRKKLGARGRAIAESEYTWEHRARQTSLVYDEVMKG